MPIYEYACRACGRVSSFLVRNLSAHRTPACPHCGATKMRRAVSRFAAIGAARKSAGAKDEPREDRDFPPPEAGDASPPDGAGREPPGPEPDLAELESLMEGVDENDPRSMGRAMRKLAETSGEPLDEEMDEVVRRLEGGEDPDKIEDRMGGVPDAGGGDELYDG